MPFDTRLNSFRLIMIKAKLTPVTKCSKLQNSKKNFEAAQQLDLRLYRDTTAQWLVSCTVGAGSGSMANYFT